MFQIQYYNTIIYRADRADIKIQIVGVNESYHIHSSIAP